MQCSRTSLKSFHSVKREAVRSVFKQAACKSTVAKSSSSGIRPSPTAEQIKELEKIGRQLVDATVTRQKKHTMKAWEKASLDERRNIIDKEVQELSHPNKPKSQERLDFEALQVDTDYTAVTPFVPTIDDSNRPKPGAFVELRRSVLSFSIPLLPILILYDRNTVMVHGVILNEELQGNTVKVNVITQRGEIWSNNPEDIMVSIPDFTPEHILDQISASDEAVGTQDAMARLKIIKELDIFEQQITVMTNYYAPVVSKVYQKVRSRDPTRWSRVSLEDIVTSHPPPKSQPNKTVAIVALHKLFMLDPLHFVATEVHRSSLEFSVRPLDEVENVLRVRQWIRTNSIEVASFIDKAKAIASLPRDIRDQSPQDPPAPHDISLPTLSPSDRHIIEFLRCAIRKHSAHQTSPYESFAPTIIKRLGIYKADITGNIIFNFLRDIGTLEPWHDMILLTEEKEITAGSSKATVSKDETTFSVDKLDSQRHDWGQLPVYVIDAADAEELDDGISIERLNDGSNWLHIHVADPTSHLTRESPLALAAAAQGCSMYGPQKTLSMLPSSYTMSRYSLGNLDGGDGQKVLTFSAHLDKDGHVLESRVRAGVIHNVHVITYAAVENAWGEPSYDLRWPFGDELSTTPQDKAPSSEAISDLKGLRELGLQQQHRRAQLGRMSWTMPQPKVFFPDRPVPTSSSDLQLWTGYPRMLYGVERRELSPARAMVAEAMILASRVAGSFCAENGLPGLFRAAGKPLGAPVNSTSGGSIPAELVMRSQIASRPAYYSTTPSEHWQLGVGAETGGYVRVTSPLRRFADMVMHWQIKAVLQGEKKPGIPLEEMQKYAAHLHERESVIKSINRAQQGYWAAIFIQRRLKYQPDEPVLRNLQGYAFTSAEFDTFSRLYTTPVLVPVLGIKGWLSTTKKPEWNTGDNIKVRVADVTMVGKAKIRLEVDE